jgi:hypothetical protein
MAGSLTISTLKNDTGVLAVQNGMTGIPKAWVNWAGASGTINNSFNVSSITRTATGTYTINFTTAMPSSTYAYAGMSLFNSSTRLQVVAQDYRTTNTTSAMYVVTGYAGGDTNIGALVDVTTACVAVFSS